jgi:hypothetical protein
MSPDEQDLILGLVIVPGRGAKNSPEDVLRHFGTTDGSVLGLTLLRDAVRTRDAVDVECALIVCSTFGVTMDHLPLLLELTSSDWHFKHEDVVTELGRLRAPKAVDALYKATQWVPSYLEFDDSRALATKAIWALGGTPGDAAERALVRLLDSPNPILREGARDQLRRRGKS